jgi:hypothetical protein
VSRDDWSLVGSQAKINVSHVKVEEMVAENSNAAMKRGDVSEGGMIEI